MPTGFGHDLTLVGMGFCLLVAAGCATSAPPPRPVLVASVPAAVANPAAVRAGVQAMAEFRREYEVALAGKRAPAYAPSRNDLAAALAALQPARERPPVAGQARSAVCLETLLAAMDRIIAATKAGDARAEAVGWEMFDQAAAELLLTLKPPAPSRR